MTSQQLQLIAAAFATHAAAKPQQRIALEMLYEQLASGVLIPGDLLTSEHGNTLMACEDQYAGWFKLDDDNHLEMSLTPGNSPMLYLSVHKRNTEKLGKHVRKLMLRGWDTVRNNIDGFEDIHLTQEEIEAEGCDNDADGEGS